MPHRGYPTRRGPSYGSSERSPPVYILSARGSWTVAPHPPGRCVPSDSTQLFQDADRPNHNDELDIFQSFRTRPQRGGPTPQSHVEVVRIGHVDPLKSST